MIVRVYYSLTTIVAQLLSLGVGVISSVWPNLMTTIIANR